MILRLTTRNADLHTAPPRGGQLLQWGSNHLFPFRTELNQYARWFGQNNFQTEPEPYPVSVRRAISLKSGNRRAAGSYLLENRSRKRQIFLFAVEMDIRLKDVIVNRLGEARGVERWVLLDPAKRLEMTCTFDPAARVWYFPLEEEQRVGSRTRRIYRGVRQVWVWPVRLDPGKSWRVQWEVEVDSPQKENSF